MSSRTLSLISGTTLTLTDTYLCVERTDKSWPKVQTSLRNVLWACIDESVVEVSLLAKKTPKSPLSLLHLMGSVLDADKGTAALFAESIMDAAYAGLLRQRRLKVLVNPRSGPGKAAVHYRKKIEPIFKAAKCTVDLTFTARVKHAQEVIEQLPLDQYDAIVAMSGDGLIHEIFNGFAAHAEPARAFRIPITPIPTGSGNGLAINLLGSNDVKDISVAALNAIKGRLMDVDLFSVTQGDKRYISFMTQSLGMMAELDLGTEHLRFMGGQRFVVGFIYEVLKNKAHPIKVSIKVAHNDKHKMVADMRASRAEAQTIHSAPSSEERRRSHAISGGLPELKHTGTEADKDGWLTFDKPFTYFFAGKGPYVSADLIQFPVSLPNDGFIDVVIAEQSSRLAMIRAMDAADTGGLFWMKHQHCFKAYAYRIEPQNTSGFLSIDGEHFPFEPFEVEVHQSLGAFLSMYGYYQVDFDLPAGKTTS